MKYLPSWLPGMSWKAKGALWKKDMEDVADLCVDTVRNGVRRIGCAWFLLCTNTPIQYKGVPSEPCFVNHAMEREDGTHVTSKEELDLIKWTAISLVGAGADTPVSSLLFFFLAMVVNPECVL